MIAGKILIIKQVVTHNLNKIPLRLRLVTGALEAVGVEGGIEEGAEGARVRPRFSLLGTGLCGLRLRYAPWQSRGGRGHRKAPWTVTAGRGNRLP